MPLLDTLARPLRSLRLSVTDRCNLRCEYCMPEEEYAWLPRRDILQFEEIALLVDVFTGLGVDRLRLTGGEPLTRRELPILVRMLAGRPAVRDLAMTTNGVLLEALAQPLCDAGLHRITISLDTLDAGKFRAITRRDNLQQVLAGIQAAASVRFPAGIKLDTVVIRGTNDDELAPLIEFGRGVGAEVRFIEYMDVGGATQWTRDRVFGRQAILETLGRRYGPIEPVVESTSAPAERFRLPDGSTFGIIASTTAPFCRSCDRSRLTADGIWLLCLYARDGIDLRQLLRSGAGPEAIAAAIRGSWNARVDRGAEERLAVHERSRLAGSAELREDPHLEMHTRGG